MAKQNGRASSQGDAKAGHSFDNLARELASGSISRGKALRLLGGALLGGVVASIPGAAMATHQPNHNPGGGGSGGGGNSACAHFCRDVFGGTEPAHSECTSAAAENKIGNLCSQCGASVSNLCPSGDPRCCSQGPTACCGTDCCDAGEVCLLDEVCCPTALVCGNVCLEAACNTSLCLECDPDTGTCVSTCDAATQTCVNGQCVAVATCTATNCATGCCAGTTCITAFTNATCRASSAPGAACVPCDVAGGQICCTSGQHVGTCKGDVGASCNGNGGCCSNNCLRAATPGGPRFCGA